MPYLEKGDLFTHMLPETIDEITRADESIVTAAIAVAVSYAKSYLARFNVDALFGTNGDEYTPPTVEDENLKSKVKDIACWELIKRTNPNIDLKLLRTNYEDAVQWFNDVKKMQEAPAGWLYPVDDPNTQDPEGKMVFFQSNTKRNQHW